MHWRTDCPRLISLVLCLLTGVGHGQPREGQASENVVARVDSLTITASELRAFAAGIPADLRPESTGNTAREEYLNSLISKDLLFLEASSLRLDTVATVREQTERRWRQHVISTYRREYVYPQVHVDDEAVARHIREHQLCRHRLLAGILVDDRATAELVVQELDSGGKWADLARRYSLDERSVKQGGVLGHVNVFQARKLHIPDELFFHLPLGKHSKVLPMGERYQVLRFEADSLASRQKVADRVKPQLTVLHRQQYEEQLVDSLARAKEWRLEPQGLELLRKKFRAHRRLLPRHLSSAEATQPLFTFAGGQITLGKYVETLWRQPMRALSGWGTGDSAAVAAAADEALLSPTLLYQAAVETGVTARPEERQWRREIQLEYMIKELRRREAVGKARVSELEAEKFYEEHPALFRSEQTLELEEVLVESEEEAYGVLEELSAGKPLSAVAEQRTRRSGTRAQGGRLSLKASRSFLYPALYEVAQEAEIGAITGPVKVDKGYSVFRVLERSGGQVAPFSDAASRARAFVRSQKRDRLFQQLVQRLRKKYRTDIVIDAENLVAAIPDSLIDRLHRKRTTSPPGDTGKR